MANPLKMLKLKPSHFQLIQELKVNAPPKRVWAALLDVQRWFRFGPANDGSRRRLEPWVGGRFWGEYADGSTALHAIITYMDPGKLLRMSGPIGLSHLPVTNAFIFELQPQPNGRTLLRFCQRAFGCLDKDVGKRYGEGWKKLLPQLKELAEKKRR